MPLSGSASARAQELSLLPRLYPSEVPWAAGWDKLPRLKDWNTTSKQHVDQRWKQQAFPSGSSFRPFSLFSFHFESDNAAWTQPFMPLHSSGHRWDGECVSLSAGSTGLGISRAWLSGITDGKDQSFWTRQSKSDGVGAAEQSSPAPGSTESSTKIDLQHVTSQRINHIIQDFIWGDTKASLSLGEDTQTHEVKLRRPCPLTRRSQWHLKAAWKFLC